MSLKPNKPPNLRELFDRCLSSPRERAAVLESIPSDSPLRQELQSLLDAHDASDDFLGLGGDAPGTFSPFQLDKYYLMELIGQGGTAEVYRAKMVGPAGFEKQVAVKRILPRYAKHAGFLQLFEREARLSSGLNHPNIVHVHDFVRLDKSYLLILEYVKGKTLATVVGRSRERNLPISPYAAILIIGEVCDALDYAHRRTDDTGVASLRIIHRDVSPKNIMLTEEGDVKILDFGIAKALGQIAETQKGVLKGTAGYMSPEQASGLEVDHRSDLFSVGINLYELLAGKPLFDHGSFLHGLRQVQANRTDPQIKGLRCSEALKRIVARALRTSPEERYGTAAEMASDLRKCLTAEAPHFSKRDVGKWVQRIYHEGAEPLTQSGSWPKLISEKVSKPFSRALRPAKSRGAFGQWALLVLVIALLGLGVRKKFSRRGSDPGADAAMERRSKMDSGQRALSAHSEEKAAPGTCSVKVSSSPPGASLSINGVVLGKTPLAARVPCGLPVSCRLYLPGFRAADHEIAVNDPESAVAFRLEMDR